MKVYAACLPHSHSKDTASLAVCRDADKVSIRTAEVLSNVAGLELLQAPGVSFIIPKEYRSLPQLKGEHAMCLV